MDSVKSRTSASIKWTPSEQAMLADMRHALLRQGLATGCEHGETDEGEPWTVIYRSRDDIMVAHIARIERRYVVLWPDGASATATDTGRMTSLLQANWIRHLHAGGDTSPTDVQAA